MTRDSGTGTEDIHLSQMGHMAMPCAIYDDRAKAAPPAPSVAQGPRPAQEPAQGSKDQGSLVGNCLSRSLARATGQLVGSCEAIQGTEAAKQGQ